MRFVLKTVIVLSLLSVRMTLQAIPATELKETYQPIVDRNPFGLKPPPPPPTNNPTAQVKEKPKTELFLTGITSVGYPRMPKKAYLMTKEAAGKKEPTYYTMTEGIERDGIKLLSIDDAARKVRVHTEDGELTLSFATHGIPAPTAAAPAGKPGQPGQPGAFPLPQPGVPGQSQPINMGAQPAGGIPSPMGVNAGGTPGASTSVRQIPSRRVRAGMDASVAPNPNVPMPNATEGVPQADVDPAEQYIRAHLNKMAAEKQGIQMPPLPVIGQ